MSAFYDIGPAFHFNGDQVVLGVVMLCFPARPIADHLVIYISESLAALRNGRGHHVVEMGEFLALGHHLFGKGKTRFHCFLKVEDLASGQFDALDGGGQVLGDVLEEPVALPVDALGGSTARSSSHLKLN